MGFRDYSPGLNRFTTRDLGTGALADMRLGTDSFTANRYAFAGGNPISFVELGGHLFGMSWSDIGHATLDVVGMVSRVELSTGCESCRDRRLTSFLADPPTRGFAWKCVGPSRAVMPISRC